MTKVKWYHETERGWRRWSKLKELKRDRDGAMGSRWWSEITKWSETTNWVSPRARWRYSETTRRKMLTNVEGDQSLTEARSQSLTERDHELEPSWCSPPSRYQRQACLYFISLSPQRCSVCHNPCLDSVTLPKPRGERTLVPTLERSWMWIKWGLAFTLTEEKGETGEVGEMLPEGGEVDKFKFKEEATEGLSITRKTNQQEWSHWQVEEFPFFTAWVNRDCTN